MASSTILVTLFSPNDGTTGLLNAFARTVHQGLQSIPDSLTPEVHCMLRQTSDAHQYQLAKGVPFPDTPDSVAVMGSLSAQLTEFLKSTPVRCSLSKNGPVYLLIGAHGRPTGTSVGAIINHFQQFLRSLISFDGSMSRYWERVADAWRNVFRPSLPLGQAFQIGRQLNSNEITLTELNNILLTFFQTPLKILLLHSCSLSGLETIYEISHVQQQIACESALKGSMNVSAWIPSMARGEFPYELAGVVIPTLIEGIFSSHRLDAACIGCLNRLGSELLQKIRCHASEIETARINSACDVADLVDVWQFCDRLSQVCSPSVLTDMKQAITQSQLDSTLTTEHRRTPFCGFRGINVFFPERRTLAKVEDLPCGFKKAATEWVMFLRCWILAT